jgi:hypothetical protein
MIIKKISFTDRGSNFKFSEQVQAFTKNDFDQMLDQSGFKIIGVYGNYAMNDFNENTKNIINENKRKA